MHGSESLLRPSLLALSSVSIAEYLKADYV